MKIDFYEQIIRILISKENLAFPSILYTNTRKREYVFVRQLSMYFAKEYNLGTWACIGDRFGKDHATAMHSYKTIRNYIDTDKEKANKILIYKNQFDKLIKVNEKLDILYKYFKKFNKEYHKQMRIIKNNIVDIDNAFNNLIK